MLTKIVAIVFLLLLAWAVFNIVAAFFSGDRLWR